MNATAAMIWEGKRMQGQLVQQFNRCLVSAPLLAIAALGAAPATASWAGDPEIEWATYLGGFNGDTGNCIVADAAGNSFIAGYTESADFQGRRNESYGYIDAFVAKVDTAGRLEWMTYVGGSRGDLAYDIALDVSGNIFITGYTDSTDFAMRTNDFYGGFVDAFVAKLSPAGDLLWMTYLGGGHEDYGFDVEIGQGGRIFLTGYTKSTDFNGRNNAHHGGSEDAFAACVDSAGLLQWMSYIGGAGDERGSDIGVNLSGRPVIAGFTTSVGFAGATNSYHGGAYDGFVVEMRLSGDIEWMKYVGGSGSDLINAISRDVDGDMLLAGHSTSNDFTGVINQHHGGSDAVVVRMSAHGQVSWARYLGGSGLQDFGRDVVGDGLGGAIITGWTNSSDFEGRVNEHHDPPHGSDAFVVTVNHAGQLGSMLYAGGVGSDSCYSVDIDPLGNAVLAGSTQSLDFDRRTNDYFGHPTDAFVARLPLVDGAFADATSLTVRRGEHIAGGLARLRTSDNRRVKIDPDFTGGSPAYLSVTDFAFHTDVVDPRKLDLIIESRITKPGGKATVYVRHWARNKWSKVHTYTIGKPEKLVTIPNLLAGRYIRQDGEIQVRIRHEIAVGPAFQSQFDLVLVRVRE